ncbi:riboflavin kinase / FMN adenylyltransferase [Corynebacterium glutamicum MB001]|uniref:Riboflavin biosynthesis protein n=3 Tax=Corynebacterium TaxID=1716 RepID=Q8NP47_CORGL|nr:MULTISPECIES: bifunctional riboflavin kinase/FAD synthetase [Corynebacterium]AGT05718.1 riboflavin kinase / FMN adenylyltransferase [Corynebacterium glutamicum MB001]AKF27720.1 riboflavin kinase [[Brevibacterium] flavum]ALP50436.1 riboflavin kinase [Corynebacterium glutamicum]AMA00453.1 bifunctional riboflavin kinase/FMN adenylyltransferase [Corynebacterium glutamicum]ANE08548.1 bifunctional riboflavin kinase/FMN adenylyltransferase [Corynebacterium glutamicum]
MDIWSGLDSVPADLQGSVVTIGVFDGLHRGHQSLIGEAKKQAEELGVPCVMVTFDPHPIAVFLPGKEPTRLAPLDYRLNLAAECGVDAALVIDFTKELAGLSAEEYFTTMIVDTLHARSVVVGENFTFGVNGAGTESTMRELGQKFGVNVTIAPLLHDDDQRICSTLVRDYLDQGEVERANWALGRRYAVRGEVVRGAGRGGKELGYPTANLYLPTSVALPADGVYAGWFTITDDREIDKEISRDIDGTMVPGVRYQTAISVGTNPTFGDERRSVEAFILDQEADLYGHHVMVEFVGHLRDMVKFNGVDELLDAMARDVTNARDILAKDKLLLDADTQPSA